MKTYIFSFVVLFLTLTSIQVSAVDKVKPLKVESISSGGGQNDEFPTETSPTQDYLAAKGIAFESNDNRLIDLDGSGNMQFKDVTQTSYITLTQLRTAVNNTFNNSTNSFTATNVQAAIEEAKSDAIEHYFGDGSDGNVSLSSGTTVLTRTMYYNNLTLSGSAILNPAGYKIYVKGTLAMSGTSSIVRTPVVGGNASGQNNGNGAALSPSVDVGPGLAGQAGVQGASGGVFGSGGVAGNNAGSAEGYGAAGGASGSAGSGTAGTAGTYTHIPERVIRHDHIYKLSYKNGGQGGAGGAGGGASSLASGGGGGGGGGGGLIIKIFARTLNNTSSIGIVARGGAGGNGGAAPSGNSSGGGGGGGGGGGSVTIICDTITSLGTINVTGGPGGTGGAGSGSGSAGGNGSAGSTGHYQVYSFKTNSWTVL